MNRFLAALLLTTCGVPAFGQVVPVPSQETPRVQTVQWSAGEPIMLMVLPDAALTVMLEPGETITRATLTGSSLWEVTVTSEADAFQITARPQASPAELAIETDQRTYNFALEAGEGLMAAYLVRVQFDGEPAQPVLEPQPEPDSEPALTWSYRLRGDRSVRPATIRDNGAKTVITYAPGQPLPAVFAIGATGEEEVVDGYMRGEAFVIDRVHRELVFRIDKEKATARRNSEEDAQP